MVPGTHAELSVELQIGDSIVAGRSMPELAYLLAGGGVSWIVFQLPGPVLLRAALAASLLAVGVAMTFVRIAGQTLTVWSLVIARYLASPRLAPYGLCRPS